MKIIHRMTVPRDSELAGRVSALLQPPHHTLIYNIGIVSFDVSESDEVWPRLCEALKGGRVIDLVRTEFSDEEMDRADWLGVIADQQVGYPQPKEAFGFRRATYDLKDHCGECGIGTVQTQPFRLERTQRCPARRVIQLNWVFDEYFTSPATWSTAWAPCGIGCRPVLNDTSGDVLETVVQLAIDVVAESPLDHPLASQACRVCGRLKYVPYVRGPYPRPHGFPKGVAAFKTKEWFGHGHSASRHVIISAELYRQLRGHGVRGLIFTPLRDA